MFGREAERAEVEQVLDGVACGPAGLAVELVPAIGTTTVWLEAVGRSTAPSAGLTPAQTRVAELLPRGMSRQEIVSTLYMSTRSVESHLIKIYRERGVRSRGELIAALAARRSGAAGGSEGAEDATNVQTALAVRMRAPSGGAVGADSLWGEPIQDD